METYSLIIKGDEQTASRELARVIYNGDYSYRVHAVLTADVAIILTAPEYVERLLQRWYAEHNVIVPPYPNGTLIHWRRVVPGDGSPSSRNL